MSFTDPQKNLQSLGLESGMDVADLGAGAGHYTMAAARIVGERGHVCAVEIQKDLVAKIKNEATSEGLTNVDVVWSDLEKAGGSTLADEVVDITILSNILFQVTDKETILKEVFRILRTGGKALVVDWSDSYEGLGPPVDRLVNRSDVVDMATRIGFIIDDESVISGAHHWGVILQK